jgi:hypothetical protein
MMDVYKTFKGFKVPGIPHLETQEEYCAYILDADMCRHVDCEECIYNQADNRRGLGGLAAFNEWNKTKGGK